MDLKWPRVARRSNVGLVIFDIMQIESEYILSEVALNYNLVININTLRPRQNGRHFPDDIFKCIFLKKMYEFRLRFHWSLLLRVQLTIFQHWFRQWLGADQATSHCLHQWWLIYWRIFASRGLDELMAMGLIQFWQWYWQLSIAPLSWKEPPNKTCPLRFKYHDFIVCCDFRGADFNWGNW